MLLFTFWQKARKDEKLIWEQLLNNIIYGCKFENYGQFNLQTLGCDAKNVSLHLVAEQYTMKHANQDEGVWKLKKKKKEES